MKDGAVICNSGHFDIEIDKVGLEKMSKEVQRGVRNNVDAFIMKNGKRIYLLAEGRLVILSRKRLK
jgi:adenosylhomocysteinase